MTYGRGKRASTETLEAVAEATLRRGLPNNIEAESAVLGCCLSDGAVPAEVVELLDENAFFVDRHRAIWRAMLELQEASTPIDYLTLEAKLSGRPEFEHGVLSALADLNQWFGVSSRLQHYAELVAEQARLRRIITVCDVLASEALEGETPAVEIAGRGAGLMVEIDHLSRAADVMTLRDAMADETLRRRLLDPHQHRNGVQTGLLSLDRLTGGFAPGELTVLAARPSMGKTAMALTIGAYVSRTAPVLVLSCESTREALLNRLICAEARVDGRRRRDGLLNDDERRRVAAAIKTLADRPLHIAEAAGATVQRCVSIARRIQSKGGGLGLVVVDYLQLLTVQGKVENRTQEISSIARGLQRMALDLKIPVLALSQLNRAVENRSDPRPKVSDLRESGEIEQAADRIMLLFRPEQVQRDRPDLEGIAELDLAKQRDGPTALLKLVFLKTIGRFENMAEDLDEPNRNGGSKDDDYDWMQ